MRLINNCLFFITITLSLLNYSFAVTTSRNIVSKSEDGVGCTGTITSSNAGFIATAYSYGAGAALGFKFYDDDWVADSYTSEEVLFTASNVTSPNFSITSNLFGSETLYDNAVNIGDMIVQLTGYFRGMYSTFVLFFISFFVLFLVYFKY